jgi:hypothetical protein
MKVFFKKAFFVLKVACILWAPAYWFYLIVQEMWVPLIKFALCLGTGILLGYIEFFGVIAWKWKKVFKYNDFD